MKETLLEQGLDLLIFGMGAVFIFLTVLVICTLLTSWIIGYVFPEAPEPVVPLPPVGEGGARVSSRTLAVIQAAIHKHRARRR